MHVWKVTVANGGKKYVAVVEAEDAEAAAAKAAEEIQVVCPLLLGFGNQWATELFHA